MNNSGLTILIRNSKGKIFEAKEAKVSFNAYTVTIHYEGLFELPQGIYVYTGVRYPDGHEKWIVSIPQTIGFFGGPLTVFGSITVS